MDIQSGRSGRLVKTRVIREAIAAMAGPFTLADIETQIQKNLQRKLIFRKQFLVREIGDQIKAGKLAIMSPRSGRRGGIYKVI